MKDDLPHTSQNLEEYNATNTLSVQRFAFSGFILRWHKLDEPKLFPLLEKHGVSLVSSNSAQQIHYREQIFAEPISTNFEQLVAILSDY